MDGQTMRLGVLVFGWTMKNLYMIWREKSREIANNGESLWKRKEAFKDLIEDMNPLANTCTMFTDLLNAAISEIDWLEIVEHYLDED
jgi:hypothetical protein